MIIDELKLVIDENLPDKKEELLWIVNHLTNILEIQQKEEIQYFQDIQEEYPEMIYYLLNIIKQICKNIEDRKILFQYLLDISNYKLLSYIK